MKMNRLQKITLILIALLGAGLAALGMIAQLPIVLLLSVLMAAFWCAITIYGNPNLHLVFFIVFLALISMIIFSRISFIIMVLLVILDIAAWNLGEFSHRALRYDDRPNNKRMENLRMKQLAIPLAIGFVLAVVPMVVRVQLPFLLTAILFIAAVVLVGLGIREVREKSGE